MAMEVRQLQFSPWWLLYVCCLVFVETRFLRPNLVSAGGTIFEANF